jgi:hypothetical protein
MYVSNLPLQMIKQERKDSYLGYNIQAISQNRLKPALHVLKCGKEGIVRFQGVVRASLSDVVPYRTKKAYSENTGGQY